MNNEIGEKIKSIRQEKGLTQEELAHLSGVHSKTVQNLEYGSHSTTIGVLKKVCDALGAKIFIVTSEDAKT